MPAIIVVPGSAFSSRSIPALLARCDVYEFATETLFQRGATLVTLPSTANLYDGGRYPDLVAFLNGYGSQLGQSMSEALNADWTAGGGVPAPAAMERSTQQAQCACCAVSAAKLFSKGRRRIPAACHTIALQ